jgi:hypothetical protein
VVGNSNLLKQLRMAAPQKRLRMEATDNSQNSNSQRTVVRLNMELKLEVRPRPEHHPQGTEGPHRMAAV